MPIPRAYREALLSVAQLRHDDRIPLDHEFLKSLPSGASPSSSPGNTVLDDSGKPSLVRRLLDTTVGSTLSAKTSTSSSSHGTSILGARAIDLSLDKRIGIVVGVLLVVFFIGLFAFLWTYRKTIKFRYRKKKPGAKEPSGGSSSGSSQGGKGPGEGGRPGS